MDNQYSIVRVDSKGRLSLGGFISEGYYNATVHEDGVITLEPVKIEPARTTLGRNGNE